MFVQPTDGTGCLLIDGDPSRPEVSGQLRAVYFPDTERDWRISKSVSDLFGVPVIYGHGESAMLDASECVQDYDASRVDAAMELVASL